MKRTFVRLPSFEKAQKALGLGEDEYTMLLLNPKAGAVMEGSGGVRKIRFALPGKGKGGSVRVIIMVDEAIYMIYAYSKSVKDTLSKAEVAQFKKLVDILKEG